jgi:hypothetical protein
MNCEQMRTSAARTCNSPIRKSAPVANGAGGRKSTREAAKNAKTVSEASQDTFPIDEPAAVDDFRFGLRMPSRAAAGSPETRAGRQRWNLKSAAIGHVQYLFALEISVI